MAFRRRVADESPAINRLKYFSRMTALFCGQWHLVVLSADRELVNCLLRVQLNALTGRSPVCPVMRVSVAVLSATATMTALITATSRWQCVVSTTTTTTTLYC